MAYDNHKKLWNILAHKEFLEAQRQQEISKAQRYYDSLPLEDIPEMKKYDYAEKDWNKLPRLITV